MKPIRQLCIALLAAFCCHAQQPDSIPPEIQRKLGEIRQAPPSQWIELSAKILIPYLNDQLWPVAQQQDARLGTMPKPTIDIRMEVAEEAPFTEDVTVIYPGLFIAQSGLSSFLVSHDLYVDSGRSFPVLDPVLQRPYAVGLVMHWLDLSSVNLRSPVFSGLFNSLMCYGRDERCSSLQVITWSATLSFALAHEYGHIAAGDSGAKEFAYSAAKELAADAFAFKLLKAFGGSAMLDDETKRDFYELGPVALLAVHASGIPAGAARTDLEARVEALLKLLPDDSQEEYRTLSMPEKSFGMASIRIAWNQEPDWIAIDGVMYSPGELRSQTLRVTAELHNIVAVGAGGFAWNEISAHGSSAVVRLEFRPFTTEAADAAVLAKFRKDGEWGDIVVRTATPQLRSKNPAFTFPLFEALRKVQLSSFIPVVTPPKVTNAEQRRLERWAQEDKPLSAWRP